MRVMSGFRNLFRALSLAHKDAAAARPFTSAAAAPCKIAVVQMCSSSDVEANARSCLNAIKIAASRGARVVFLPECFLYISGGNAPASQPKPLFSLNHPVLLQFRDAAAANNVWLSLGGFALKSDGPDPRAHNAHALIAADGSVAGVYHKIHLFDAAGKRPSLSCATTHASQCSRYHSVTPTIIQFNFAVDGIGAAGRESSYTCAGARLCAPVASPAGAIALQTCYDMRFAVAANALRRMGADIITCVCWIGLVDWVVLRVWR